MLQQVSEKRQVASQGLSFDLRVLRFHRPTGESIKSFPSPRIASIVPLRLRKERLGFSRDHNVDALLHRPSQSQKQNIHGPQSIVVQHVSRPKVVSLRE